MNTEFFARMYLGGAAHRWHRDSGKGNGLGGNGSLSSLIAGDGTSTRAAPNQMRGGGRGSNCDCHWSNSALRRANTAGGLWSIQGGNTMTEGRPC